MAAGTGGGRGGRRGLHSHPGWPSLALLPNAGPAWSRAPLPRGIHRASVQPTSSIELTGTRGQRSAGMIDPVFKKPLTHFVRTLKQWEQLRGAPLVLGRERAGAGMGRGALLIRNWGRLQG